VPRDRGRNQKDVDVGKKRLFVIVIRIRRRRDRQEKESRARGIRDPLAGDLAHFDNSQNVKMKASGQLVRRGDLIDLV
jgi:hypothetical protein